MDLTPEEQSRKILSLVLTELDDDKAEDVVSIDLAGKSDIADHMVVLHEGKVLEQGPPEQIRKSKNPVIRQFIEGEAEGPIRPRMADTDYEKAILEGPL